MDKNQTEKSQAELYREERKQRMAKAAKKNAKKSPQLEKLGSTVGRVLGIVIVVALCAVVLYSCLNFFGVPQKVLTATKVGDQKVSVAKYNFYYYDIYSQYYTQAYQYENYYGEGSGLMYTGYDVSKTPYDQEYTLGTVEGYDKPTWGDFFESSTLDYIQSYVSYAQLAREAGITVTEEQQSQLDEQIASIRETAEKNDFSLNRYLTKIYGKGVNEKLLREVYEERNLAYNYATSKQEELTTAVTADEISAEFNENIKNYTKFSISLFEVTATPQSLADDATDEQKQAANDAAMNEAKSLAEGYLAKVTTADSVLAVARSYKATIKETTVNLVDTDAATVSTTYGDKVVEWIFADGRVAGDKAVVETDDGYVVICISTLPARETAKAVDVRHILVQFETSQDSNGNAVELTDGQKAGYYSTAKTIYDSYLANPTEDNFIALAKEKTDDTGSKENGGLYEQVVPGQMVSAFNDWIFDLARKPGDTDIVETEYGYHIMYFVGNDHEEVWQINCRAAIAQEKFKALDDEITSGETYALKNNESVIKWAIKMVEDAIKLNYANRSK